MTYRTEVFIALLTLCSIAAGELSLLKYSGNIYCIEGDVSKSSALAIFQPPGYTRQNNPVSTWRSPAPPPPQEMVEALSCDLTVPGRCPGWEKGSMTRVSNFEASTLPPVFDPRWERFPFFQHMGGTNFNNRMPLVNPRPERQHLNLHFSVLAESDANLLLHTTENHYNSPFYLVVIDGWANHMSALRKCQDGWPTVNYLSKSNPDCYNLKVTKADTPLLNKTKWTHFTIRVIRSSDHQAHISLLSQEKEGKETVLLEWIDTESPIDVNFVSLRFYEKPGHIRFNNYDVLLLDSEAAEVSVPPSAASRPLCVAVTFLNSAGPGRLQLVGQDGDALTSVELRKGGWQLSKLEATLQENVNYKLELRVEKTNRGRFFLGEVRVCSPNEFHVATLQTSGATTCMNLMTEENIYTREIKQSAGAAFPSCPGETFGPHCDLTCSLVSGSSACFYSSFCDVNTCSCSAWGFTGDSCVTTCPLRSYGRGCNSTCGKCSNKWSCNTVNGACPNGGCEDGWTGERCDIPRIIALSAISTEDSITLTLHLIEHEGVDTSHIHGVQVKVAQNKDSNEEIEWTDHVKLTWPVTNSVTISGLKGNTGYLVRVLLLDKEMVPIKQQEDVRKKVTTKCKTVDLSEFQVTPHQTYFTVTLNVKEPAEMCPTTNYWVGVNYKNSNLNPLENLPVNITGLEANTQYKLFFSKSNFNMFREEVFKTTPGPPGPVESLAVDTSLSGTARVTWAAPIETNGGEIVKYIVTRMKDCHTVNDCNGAARVDTDVPAATPGDVTTVNIPLSSLVPNSRYQVAVRAFTEEEGPERSVYFQTPPVPDLVHDLQFDSTTGMVKWTSVDQIPTYQLTYKLVCLHDKEDVEECSEKHPEDEERSSGFVVLKVAEFALPYDKMHPSATYNVTVAALKVYLGPLAFTTVRTPEATMGTSHVAAIVVPILFLLGLVLVLVLLWLRRKRRKAVASHSDQQRLHASASPGGEVIPSGLDVVPVPERSVAWRRSPVKTPDLNAHMLPDPTAGAGQILSRPVRLAELEQYVETGLASGEIRKQHAMFPRGQTQPWGIGRLPENKKKNRYGNLVAYDATRVTLVGEQNCDYINANYIDGYNNPKAYIATQGPKENTVDDFWHMVWQENVHLILALANCVEGGKAKVAKYWPDAGRQDTYDDVEVSTTSQEVFADFTFRHLEVHYQASTRKVLQLHFTSWPDHGVPMYPQSVATYLKKILCTNIVGPVLVHCSAGVGRTGTVILAVACLRMAAVEGQVDPLNLLQIMRAQRPNMVDNADQYELVHVVLLECLVADSFNIECTQFPAQLRQMLAEKRSILGRQFSRLNKLCQRDAALKKVRSDYSWPHDKSRFPDIVPGSIGRVILSRSTGSDFINAVYVDGFRQKSQFIATQNPLPATMDDFWHMLVQTGAGLVLVLNQPDPSSDPSSCTFWPEADSELVLSDTCSLVLKHQSESKMFEYRNLQLRSERRIQGSSECTQHRVNVITLRGWAAGQQLPPSTDVLLELWEEAERMFAGTGPIVVTCHDGATACGLFLAVSFVVEKMKLEQEVDVGLAVRIMRLARPQFLESLDQFEFVHQVALNYLDTFETYANFT